MQVKNPKELSTPHVTRGSVLDDLWFSAWEALEIKMKAEIYREFLAYIKARGFNQQSLAVALGVHQPEVSHLLNGRISKFSVGKLMKFGERLNFEAEVRIMKPPF